MNAKTYLGDSVYAQFDGWQVVLTTENGMPSDPSNTIVLDLRVLAALFTYVKYAQGAAAQETPT